MELKLKIKLIGLLAIFLGFFACKETLVDPTDTALSVEVKDDLGQTLSENDIEVYLFMDSLSYMQSVVNKLPSGYVAKATTSNGVAKFTGLNSTTLYWVYIDYQGKGYTLNNYFAQNKLYNYLPSEATTFVTIQLEAFNIGHLSFWSADQNIQQEGIEVFFQDEQNSRGIIEVATSKPSEPNQPNTVSVLYQNAGDYTWYAKGDKGCVWQGQVTIPEGQQYFEAIELEACEQGRAGFWIMNDALSQAGGQVLVILNNADTLGVIGQGRSNSPANCADNGVLSIMRPKGSKAIYKAYSKDKKCVWMGDVTFSQLTCGSAQLIELEKCQ